MIAPVFQKASVTQFMWQTYQCEKARQYSAA